jgi:hypothetical protein
MNSQEHDNTLKFLVLCNHNYFFPYISHLFIYISILKRESQKKRKGTNTATLEGITFQTELNTISIKY